MNHSHDCSQCACHNPLWKSLENSANKASSSNALNCFTNDNPNLKPPKRKELIMYSGGTIRPMIGGETGTVEAIGFADGKVVAVGSHNDVASKMKALGLRPEDHISLPNEHTLLPGLIEPHVHIIPTAMTMSWPDLGPYQGQHLKDNYCPDSIISEAKKNLAKLSTDDWILGTGVDPALMPFRDGQLDIITIDKLDEAFPDRGVYWISASMHTAYINSVSLNAIAEGMKYEEKSSFIKKIRQQGALQELEQMTQGFTAIPESQRAEITANLPENIYKIFKTANERGVTMMFEAGMRPQMKEQLEEYQAVMPQNIRVGYALLCENTVDTDNLKHHKSLTESDLYQPFVVATKLVSDGSNQGLTGYQSEPYCCEPDNNCGIFNFCNPPACTVSDACSLNYQKMVDDIIKKGWPLLIHANGNEAVDLALDVYDKALDGESGLTSRHRIEHCSLLSDNSAKRMQKLGISPSFLIGHVGYWGYAFEQVIFKEKSQLLDRCNTMLELNARITLHSDFSVSPIGPLRMMEQAVTRIMEKSPEKSVLSKDECISKEQGLRAITYDAAWQCHTEQWLGSLEPGRLADYIILAEDPLSIKDDTKLRDIPVLETWVGGRRFHSEPSANNS